MDIEKIRRDTPGTDYVYHFNSAGSSLPPQIVLEQISEYLCEEAITGGYLMAERYEQQINDVYVQAARLINCRPEEIAMVENASTGFNKALFSIPFKKGDVILTSQLEYGTNFLNFMKLRDERGIEIRTAAYGPDGGFDARLFEEQIDERVRLIAITHVPTQSGFVSPAAEIGKLARKYGILYLLDACQSVGQLPVDVAEIQCDFLSTTSRKYIRGPRGVGFLYVNKNVLTRLNPAQLDMLYAEWTGESSYQLNYSAKMFENWEKPYALIIGLGAALAYINQLGILPIHHRVQQLSGYLRERIDSEPGLSCCDPGTFRCGIVTFQKKGVDESVVRKVLQNWGINIAVSPRSASYADMKSRALQSVNRASVHYFNTEEEIDHLIEKLRLI